MKHPQQIRQENRNNEHFKQSSNYGAECPGFLQSNITIIPSQFADDFKKFCELNPAPLPLLYMSKAGEHAAPLLAKDSDIRTDISTYKVFKDGSLKEIVPNILDYNLEDMVAFYFGCSFTFESMLISNGIKIRNIDEGKNCSMYVSNIQCHSSGPFSTPMVVTMRPIQESLLDTAFACCMQSDFCHGAPVHIGNEKDIGIDFKTSTNLGHNSSIEEGEVPVFWACGVTSALAVSAAKFTLSFSHYPGSMFLCDIDIEQAKEQFKPPHYPPAKVICLNKKTQTYSVLSEKCMTCIYELEQQGIEDPGNRNVKGLLVSGDLMKASLNLSQSAKAVCIVTGFPLFEDSPREENDGIAGAIALARALQALSTSVTLLVDKAASPLFHKIVHWCHVNGILKHEVPVVSMNTLISPKENLFDLVTGEPRFSHLIAIERPGKNRNGTYCSMTGKEINCDPLDDLFNEALEHDDIVTIGIGDGGNEIGMGNVKEMVFKDIKLGTDIGCIGKTDYLVTCGVSNWGGYIFAGALYAVLSCPVHERYRRHGIGSPKCALFKDFVTTKEQEVQLQRFLVTQGIRDGVSGKVSMTVDGLDFNEYHCKKIEGIHSVCSRL